MPPTRSERHITRARPCRGRRAAARSVGRNTSHALVSGGRARQEKSLVCAIRAAGSTSARAREAVARRIYPVGHPFYRRRQERRAEPLSRASFILLRCAIRDRDPASSWSVTRTRTDPGWPERRLAPAPGPDASIPEVPVPLPGARLRNDRDARMANATWPWRRLAGLTRSIPRHLAVGLANPRSANLADLLARRARARHGGLTYGSTRAFTTHLAGPFVVTVT